MYTIHPYLQRRWDAVGRKLACRTDDLQSFKAWRSRTRKILRRLIGYDTMIRCALNPTITDHVECDGYLRQHVEIQTEPGVVMPMYVLVPHGSNGPHPVVLAPHGHCGGGKAAVAGCRDNPEVAQAIDHYNYDYGVQFVQAGFITFCPDARGFGQRREKASQDQILACSCQWINHMAYPLGQTVTGMWTWDIHRLIDYAQTRTDCRHDRIGCAGLSGGGHQTLWATALDERIACAVVSGYFYGYKQALLDLYENCTCNYVPHLYEYVDMGDIGALIAPRRLLIETGTEDELNGADALGNVTPQVHVVRRAYELFGAGASLEHDVFEGGHRWHGEKAIPWMQSAINDADH